MNALDPARGSSGRVCTAVWGAYAVASLELFLKLSVIATTSDSPQFTHDNRFEDSRQS